MRSIHAGQTFEHRPARLVKNQPPALMEVRLLGELQVFCDGQNITPAAPKQRQAIAMLALNPGRIVPTSTLIDELWGERPPRSAMTTLQTYVLHLRSAIDGALRDHPGDDAKSVLATRRNGYLLDVAEPCTDVVRFHELTLNGHLALDRGDLLVAGELLREALLLWRGGALVDIAAGHQLSAHITSLEEARLSLLQELIGVELRLGLHHRSLGELAALTVEYPMHEGFHAQYMLALYRCGRRERALEIYHRLRSVLLRELGLEPVSGVRQLQTAILNADPNLSVSSWWDQGSLIGA